MHLESLSFFLFALFIATDSRWWSSDELHDDLRQYLTRGFEKMQLPHVDLMSAIFHFEQVLSRLEVVQL